MRSSPTAILLFVILGGSGRLSGQAQSTTTQLDYWNWYAVKAPAAAQGIVVDPVKDSTWYVASNSGLYITRDGGTTWTQSLTGSVSTEAIAIDPVNPIRIYVGAGSSIYFSADSGVTWNKSASFSQAVASVFVSLTDGSVFVGPRASGFSGIYRSRDQGSTWTPIAYGAGLSAINTTWDIAEDGSGWLWAATQESLITPGKNMLLRSADRGATWVSVAVPLTMPPSRLLRHAATSALYVASRGGGVIATGNQGARWDTIISSPTVALVIAPLPSFVSAASGVIAGLDTGGGVAFAYTISHSDLIDPSVSGPGISTMIGLPGVPIQALALNHSGTQFVAVSGDGGIFGGTIMQPQLNPAIVNVSPGGSLLITCHTCPFGTSMQIIVDGQKTDLLETDAPDSRYGQLWNVPLTMRSGTYSAQLITIFPPLSLTVVVGTATPAITTLESIRFAVKPQYALGEVVTLFGNSLTAMTGSSPAANYSTDPPLATQLAQAEVLVDGIPAPLYYAYTGADGKSQINFQIPYTLAPGSHQLQVSRLLASGAVDASTTAFPFTVAAVSPTYVTDSAGIIYVQDNTRGPAGNVFANATTPARAGDVATLYATGLGATTPAITAGGVPPPGTLADVAAPISIALWDGSVSQWKVNVLGAVASPQFPGLYQIALQFPGGVTPGGNFKLIIAVGPDTQTFPVAFAP